MIIAIISVAEQAPDSTSTRERLLEAAATVIARDGYQGARLADVAREAGLTTGAIYSNFRDKQELFLAAFDRVQHLAQNLALDKQDLGAVLESAPAAILHFAHSSQLQILNLELALLATRDPELLKLLRGGARAGVKELAKRLPEGVDEREQRASLMIALLNGLAFQRMIGADDVPVEGVVPWLRRLAGLDP